MIDRTAVLEHLDDEDQKLVDFAMGYADRMARRDPQFPLAHIDHFAGRYVAQARLLQVVLDLPVAWAKAKELGEAVDQAYWDEFSIYGRGSFQLVNEAGRRLLDHGRPAAALDLMQLYMHGDRKSPDPKLVAEGLKALGSVEEDLGRLSTYGIETLISYLRQTDTDEDEVAMLEWKLLPALGHEPRGLFLERKLARDPAFFVEILSLCFRTNDMDEVFDDMDEVSDLPQHVATNAYRLLGLWHTMPGSTGPGQPVSADALDAWYIAAKPLLMEAKRLDIGEQVFGKTLAHGPADEDGRWPDHVVRSFIEKVASEQVETGFRIECFNKRGVVSRSLDEGGKQEYVLADQYARWADRIAVTAPRTALILRSLADGYRADGRREDEEARRRREGFDD
jgi:hypothetical protein